MISDSYRVLQKLRPTKTYLGIYNLEELVSMKREKHSLWRYCVHSYLAHQWFLAEKSPLTCMRELTNGNNFKVLRNRGLEQYYIFPHYIPQFSFFSIDLNSCQYFQVFKVYVPWCPYLSTNVPGSPHPLQPNQYHCHINLKFNYCSSDFHV